MADEFSQRSLAGARFDDADFSGVKIRGAVLRDVDIGGELAGLRVNGIDVGPLVEAELDRRRRPLQPR